MSGVYAVQGKLGTGKTKFCVWRAQQALRDGLRVASNVDLVLEKLTPERRSHYIRIPTSPAPMTWRRSATAIRRATTRTATAC